MAARIRPCSVMQLEFCHVQPMPSKTALTIPGLIKGSVNLSSYQTGNMVFTRQHFQIFIIPLVQGSCQGKRGYEIKF